MEYVTVFPIKPKVGQKITCKIPKIPNKDRSYRWVIEKDGEAKDWAAGTEEYTWDSEGADIGDYVVKVSLPDGDDPSFPREGYFTLTSGSSAATSEFKFQVPPDTVSTANEAVRSLADAVQDKFSEAADRFKNLGGLPVSATLRRTQVVPTSDVALWATILHSTKALSFNRYNEAMELVLCGVEPTDEGFAKELKAQDLSGGYEALLKRRYLPFNNTEAYRFLKVATEAYLLANAQSLGEVQFTPEDRLVQFTPEDQLEVYQRLNMQVDLEDQLDDYLVGKPRSLPYLALVQEKLGNFSTFGEREPIGVLSDEQRKRCQVVYEGRLTSPLFIELIWSYWQEEGMLVQTMNVISRRFQNVHGPGERDPLANMEIDPLRPLNNLIWGYLQDEQHRLSVPRRTLEYNHHYGINLQGRAVGAYRFADSRSKFLEAFHNLLYLAHVFYQQDDDTTVIANGFPILNALRDVHMILSQGAHNQFGDLPSTARQEMLLQQWLLARPQFSQFLPTRIMVAYPQPWMDRVDAMKSLQGWTDTSVMHFHNLAEFGERLLLSIRYGAWSAINHAGQAANWARFWRQEIQGYVYAYRTATGIDLSADVVDSPQATERYLPPAIHLQRQLDLQKRGALPAAQPAAVFPVQGRARLPR